MWATAYFYSSIFITNNYNIHELYYIYSSKYITVILNILDNIYNNITLSELIKIYESAILLYKYDYFKIHNNINDIQYSILYSIIIPRYYIIKNNIKFVTIKYNKYTSKSIIIAQLKNIYQNNYEIYILLILLLNNNYLLKFKDYYIQYNCNKKILKYYISLNKLINNIDIKKKILNNI